MRPIHPTANQLNTLTCIHPQPFLVHKIYQLDYSRKTGAFRMLEHFLPQVNTIHNVMCASLAMADPSP